MQGTQITTATQWSDLPAPLAIRIAEELDLCDLFSFRLTCRLWAIIGNEAPIWKAIASKIDCPLEEGVSHRRQVKSFIRFLYEDFLLPSDKMRKIDIKEIRFQQTFLRARDVCNVWVALAHTLSPFLQENVLGKAILFRKDYIDKAPSFDPWFAAHLHDLAQWTNVDLSELNLTHLPPQVFNLTGIITLNLTCNRLTRLPPLAAFAELKAFSIAGNPLNPKPTDPLELPPNLNLAKWYLSRLPKELNFQLAVHLGYPAWKTPTCDSLTTNYIDYEVDRAKNIKFKYGKAPGEIKRLIEKRKTLTVAEFKYLIQWRKARDVLITWKVLAEQLNPAATCLDIFGVEETHFASVEDFCLIAAGFPKWLEDHEEKLDRLPVLLLNHQNLGDVEFPRELGTSRLLGKVSCPKDELGQGSLYHSIRAYIDCPIYDIDSFVNLLEDSIFNKPRPEDINEILDKERNCLTVDEIKTLHDWIKTRNILDVWNKLRQSLGEEMLNDNDFETSKIDLARPFQKWFRDNKIALVKLEALDLSNLELFYLPKEIEQLTGLKSLNLSNNPFLKMPPQVWKLTQLEEIDLSSNRNLKEFDLEEMLSPLVHLQKFKIDEDKNFFENNEIAKDFNFNYNYNAEEYYKKD